MTPQQLLALLVKEKGNPTSMVPSPVTGTEDWGTVTIVWADGTKREFTYDLDNVDEAGEPYLEAIQRDLGGTARPSTISESSSPDLVWTRDPRTNQWVQVTKAQADVWKGQEEPAKKAPTEAERRRSIQIPLPDRERTPAEGFSPTPGAPSVSLGELEDQIAVGKVLGELTPKPSGPALAPGITRFGNAPYRLNTQTGEYVRDPTLPDYEPAGGGAMPLTQIQQMFRDHTQTIEEAKRLLATGQIDEAAANDLVARSYQNLVAGSQGLTMAQKQAHERAQMDRGLDFIQNRVDQGTRLVGQILQAGQNVMMPRGATTMGIDPGRAAEAELRRFGSTEEMTAFVKGLVYGKAAGGQGGPAPGPSSLSLASQPAPGAAPNPSSGTPSLGQVGSGVGGMGAATVTPPDMVDRMVNPPRAPDYPGQM